MCRVGFVTAYAFARSLLERTTMSIRSNVRHTKHDPLRLLEEARHADIENRIADTITTFAGSMPFVYLHIVWFTLWFALGVEEYPYGLLTMMVSLEAIFLSTFVMISQNRADAKRQVVADHQWEFVQTEEQQNEQQNEQLLDLSNQILSLTKAIHSMTAAVAPAAATEGPADEAAHEQGTDPRGGAPSAAP